MAKYLSDISVTTLRVGLEKVTSPASGTTQFSGAVSTDTVSEKTAAAGVTLDGVKLKDSAINLSSIAQPTPDAGGASLGYVGLAFTAVLSQGITLPIPLGASEGLVSYKNHLGYAVVNAGATPFLSANGLLSDLTATGTIARTIDTNGVYNRYTTAATTGSVGGIGQTAALIRKDMTGSTWLLVKFRLPTTTSVRMFIGLTDQTLATMVGADNPAGNYIGIQYSTARADTNFQKITKDGTTQKVTDTALAIDGNFHFFRMRLLAIPLTQIVNATFTTSEYSGNSVLNIPTATTPLQFVAGIDARSNSARDFDFGYAYLVGDW